MTEKTPSAALSAAQKRSKNVGLWMIAVGIAFIAATLIAYPDKSTVVELEPHTVIEDKMAKTQIMRGVKAPVTLTADESGRTQIYEAFMYTCPHCHNLYPLVEEFKSVHGDEVKLTYLPVVFRQQDMDYLNLHYGLLKLGVDEEKVVSGIFNAIHKADIKLSKPQDFQRLGVKISGLTEQQVASAMAAPEVQNDALGSMNIMVKSGMNSVPTFIIDGQYRLDAADSTGYDNLMANLAHVVLSQQEEVVAGE